MTNPQRADRRSLEEQAAAAVDEAFNAFPPGTFDLGDQTLLRDVQHQEPARARSAYQEASEALLAAHAEFVNVARAELDALGRP